MLAQKKPDSPNRAFDFPSPSFPPPDPSLPFDVGKADLLECIAPVNQKSAL